MAWSRKSVPGVFVAECDTEGEYKSTQCHEASEYCWCVDAQGNEIPGTRSRAQAVCRPSGNSCQKTTLTAHQAREKGISFLVSSTMQKSSATAQYVSSPYGDIFVLSL